MDKVARLGHQEGRHAGLSGAHALIALATAEGSRRAASVLVYALDNAVAAVLGPSQSAIPEKLILDFLDSLEYYQVPLAIRDGSFVCARGYNSQNACMQFLVWAMATGRCAIRPFTQAEVQ